MDGDTELFHTDAFQIGGSPEERDENVLNDKNIQLSQNQFQPPGHFFTFEVVDTGVKFFEMNKQNVLAILNPSQIVDTSLFVDESPRESWSHGH